MSDLARSPPRPRVTERQFESDFESDIDTVSLTGGVTLPSETSSSALPFAHLTAEFFHEQRSKILSETQITPDEIREAHPGQYIITLNILQKYLLILKLL